MKNHHSRHQQAVCCELKLGEKGIRSRLTFTMHIPEKGKKCLVGSTLCRWIRWIPAVLTMCHHVASASSDVPTKIQHWSVIQLPKGRFRSSRHLQLNQEESSSSLDAIPLDPDQVLVRVEAFSIDAFLRTLLENDSFHYSLKVGDTMRASGYGTVLRTGSNNSYKVGSRILGMLPVKNLAVVKKSPSLLPMAPIPGVKPSLHLDLLGTSGLSAYVGIFKVCTPPRKGETVVISAAAGGVGTVACQMAKLTGARVVGIAGGTEKANFLLREVGIDAAVDYKHPSRSLAEQLSEACPNGVDFFLDNVGGDTLDIVLDKINHGARIVICGAISQYDTGNLYRSPQAPQKYLKLAEQSATMSGFVVSHYLSSLKMVVSAVSYILWNYFRGKLKSFVQVEQGIESFGPALESLLNGKNIGRLVVDVTGEIETYDRAKY